MGCVCYEVEAGVARIRLNRPHRLNAINEALIGDLLAALQRAQSDTGVSVLLLEGAGRAFCAGDDLKEFEHQSRTLDDARRYLDALQAISRAIALGDKPVLCAARGYAVGGGLEWLINCDLVVMSERTECFFPEVGMGLMVTGGISATLPRLIGMQHTRSMILLGEHVDAREALSMGLVHEVVADEALEERALALARRVGALPARAVAGFKRVLARGAGEDLESVMAMEVETVARCFVDPGTAALVAESAPRRAGRGHS